MTKNEFILRTIISMAGSNEVADIAMASCLSNHQIERLIEDAQRIAEATARCCKFDEERKPNMDKVYEVLRQKPDILGRREP